MEKEKNISAATDDVADGDVLELGCPLALFLGETFYIAWSEEVRLGVARCHVGIVAMDDNGLVGYVCHHDV